MLDLRSSTRGHVFWVVTPYCLVGGYQRFRETCRTISGKHWTENWAEPTTGFKNDEEETSMSL